MFKKACLKKVLNSSTQKYSEINKKKQQLHRSPTCIAEDEHKYHTQKKHEGS